MSREPGELRTLRRACVRCADALRRAEERAGLTRDPLLYALVRDAQRNAMDAAHTLMRAEAEHRNATEGNR